jgi:hypothetical protein
VLKGCMWITRKYMKEKSGCLGALCSVFNRLKSGFSRVDFGSLLIHDSPLVTGRHIALLGASHGPPIVLSHNRIYP